MRDLGQHLRAVLDFELFHVGDTKMHVSTLLTVFLIVVLTLWASKILRVMVARGMSKRGAKAGSIGTVNGLLHYVVLFAGLGTALGTAGIDLSALFAAGAFFAVAVGFAMQSIAQNFVAGVILLVERAIKPGDVLEVEGQLVKVLDMGVRASVAQTHNGEDVIIPNNVLIQTSVKNFTLKDSTYRARVPVGVVYSADMALVRKSLEEVAASLSEKWGVSERHWQVVMVGFGDNSVNWEVAVWLGDPWRLRPALSELHEAVWWKLKEREITIAFPQLDVHFDGPVSASLARLAPRAA